MENTSPFVNIHKTNANMSCIVLDDVLAIINFWACIEPLLSNEWCIMGYTISTEQITKKPKFEPNNQKLVP